MTEPVCIVCPRGCRPHMDEKSEYKVIGNFCPKGGIYGKKELITPIHTVISTVKIRDASIARVPMKADHEILRKNIFATMHLLDGTTPQAPVYIGDIVMPNLLGFDVSFAVMRGLAKAPGTG